MHGNQRGEITRSSCVLLNHCCKGTFRGAISNSIWNTWLIRARTLKRSFVGAHALFQLHAVLPDLRDKIKTRRNGGRTSVGQKHPCASHDAIGVVAAPAVCKRVVTKQDIIGPALRLCRLFTRAKKATRCVCDQRSPDNREPRAVRFAKGTPQDRRKTDPSASLHTRTRLEGGHCLDAALGGHALARVHVHLEENEAGKLAGQLLEERRDHFARPAPRGREAASGKVL